MLFLQPFMHLYIGKQIFTAIAITVAATALFANVE